MLEVYRFVLALFVVQAHIPWSGGSGPLSQHAVFSFYVLSGFLMTLILNETYGFGAGNCARFWANRMLRLYPAKPGIHSRPLDDGHELANVPRPVMIAQ